ncbi:MAG TPA: hypothetical protein VEK82_00035 [Stellaceae bacterium]|nr:hypothetical protein [Stellaceae bacterium]
MNRLGIIAITIPLLVVGGSLPARHAVAQDKDGRQSQHLQSPGDQRAMPEMMGMMQQMSGMMEHCNRMMESHQQ